MYCAGSRVTFPVECLISHIAACVEGEPGQAWCMSTSLWLVNCAFEHRSCTARLQQVMASNSA